MQTIFHFYLLIFIPMLKNRDQLPLVADLLKLERSDAMFSLVLLSSPDTLHYTGSPLSVRRPAKEILFCCYFFYFCFSSYTILLSSGNKRLPRYARNDITMAVHRITCIRNLKGTNSYSSKMGELLIKKT